MATQQTSSGLGRSAKGNRDGFLRLAMKLDALATGAVGVLMLLAAGTVVGDGRPFVRLLGMPISLLASVGLFLVVYAVFVWVIGSRIRVSRPLAWAVIAINAVYAAGCVVVVAAGCSRKPVVERVNGRRIRMQTPNQQGEAKAVRVLLACGIVAGPLYVIVGLFQMLVRDGFDIRRHALSLLANGELGWIQTPNFLVCGLLVVAGAVGMQRVLRGGRGGRWGPPLLGLYGLGLVGVGIFRADPALGFPPGLPADAFGEVSWHGTLHLIVGAIGFVGLISACFVFARRFFTLGERVCGHRIPSPPARSSSRPSSASPRGPKGPSACYSPSRW